eukprot:190151_1
MQKKVSCAFNSIKEKLGGTLPPTSGLPTDGDRPLRREKGDSRTKAKTRALPESKATRLNGCSFSRCRRRTKRGSTISHSKNRWRGTSQDQNGQMPDQHLKHTHTDRYSR